MDVALIAEGLAFPEGPVAMADGSVIIVELAAGRITRCWGDHTETVSTPGGGPNGAAIGPDGALYVCNSGGLDTARFCNVTGPGSEGRIERIDLATGRVERLHDACDGEPLSAPNDLVFGADGTLWFTDLGKRYARITEASGLFACRPDGSAIRTVHHGAVGYNGVGLSPDGRAVYAADTFQARLYRFAVGDPEARPALVATVPGMVLLDSLAVTAAGNICVGVLIDGGIATVTPEGAVSRMSLDDRYVTNIAFGGTDMRDAYVTLSASGRLVRMRWPEPGLKLAYNG